MAAARTSVSSDLEELQPQRPRVGQGPAQPHNALARPPPANRTGHMRSIPPNPRYLGWARETLTPTVNTANRANGGLMSTLHIEHPISDFTIWKAAFDRFASSLECVAIAFSDP
jgi:hypothetical protein